MLDSCPRGTKDIYIIMLLFSCRDISDKSLDINEDIAGRVASLA